MPAYTCRTEGMALGRSLRHALLHLVANPTHRVVERRITTVELQVHQGQRMLDWESEL